MSSACSLLKRFPFPNGDKNGIDISFRGEGWKYIMVFKMSYWLLECKKKDSNDQSMLSYWRHLQNVKYRGNYIKCTTGQLVSQKWRAPVLICLGLNCKGGSTMQLACCHAGISTH